MKKNFNKDTSVNNPDKEDKPVNINPDTPISIEEFTLSDIFDSETIKMAVKTVLSFLEQTTINDSAKIDISKKQLSNHLEIRKLDIKEQELDIRADEQERIHVKWFDIRNKLYTVGMFVLVIISTALLKYYDILDKSEARTIIMIIIGLGMASNTDLVKNIFGNKQQ